jgi:hypothetical protein
MHLSTNIFGDYLFTLPTFKRHMLLQILVQPHHYDEGKITSTWNDPIAHAIREKLNLPWDGKSTISIGDDEIFLYLDKKGYTCPFDVVDFHKHWQGIPRSITLKFTQVIP